MNLLRNLATITFGSIVILSGGMGKIKNIIGGSSSENPSNNLDETKVGNKNHIKEPSENLTDLELINVDDNLKYTYGTNYAMNDVSANDIEFFALKETLQDSNENPFLYTDDNFEESLIDNFNANEINEDLLSVDSENNIKNLANNIDDIVDTIDDTNNDMLISKHGFNSLDSTKPNVKNSYYRIIENDLVVTNNENIDNTFSDKSDVINKLDNENNFQMSNNPTKENIVLGERIESSITLFDNLLAKEKNDKVVDYITNQQELTNKENLSGFIIENQQKNYEIQSAKANKRETRSIPQTNHSTPYDNLQYDPIRLTYRLDKINENLVENYITKLNSSSYSYTEEYGTYRKFMVSFSSNDIAVLEKIISVYTRYPILIKNTDLLGLMLTCKYDFDTNTNINLILNNILTKYLDQIPLILLNASMSNNFCEVIKSRCDDISEFMEQYKVYFGRTGDFKALFIELLFYKNICQMFNKLDRDDTNYMNEINSGILNAKNNIRKDMEKIKPAVITKGIENSVKSYFNFKVKFLVKNGLVNKEIGEDVVRALSDPGNIN